MNEHETWVPAYGHEEFYSVSSLGRVRSETTRRGTTKGKLLKQRRGNSNGREGRPHVILQGNGTRVKWYISRLMYFSFHGAIDDSVEIDHVNGNALDNRICNLEAVSRLENMRRAHAMGLMNTAKGEMQHRSKLTASDVAKIRRRVEGGERQSDIAREFSVTPTAINCIVKRYTWKHI